MIYDVYQNLIKEKGLLYAYCWLAHLLDYWYVEDPEVVNKYKF